RGWHTQPQLAHGELPRSIHLTVTAAVAPQVEEFAAAIAEAAAAARSHGPVQLPPELLTLVGGLQPSELTPDTVSSLAGALGVGGTGSGDDGAGPLPERQATINTLLEAAP